MIDCDDDCPGTVLSAVVDEVGCSTAQYCPCVNGWKNKGAYVSCVAKTSELFLELGLITEAEKDATVSSAAKSTCGVKK